MTNYNGAGDGERAGRRRADRPGLNRKVAVIEDDASTAALLSTLLQLEGFVAQSFDNTLDIAGELVQAQVDFVLCDDNMPDVRGPQIIAAIRQEPELDSVPVVLMSGMYHDEREWRAVGADGFLIKPFTRQELLDSLRLVAPAGSNQ